MFAQRFDPTAVSVAPANALRSRKRKLSTASFSASESDSGDKSELESDSSDSSLDSSSSSSDSEEESDSESEEETMEEAPEAVAAAAVQEPEDTTEADVESEKVPEPEKVADEDKMDIDDDYVSKHLSVFQKFKSARPDDEMEVEEPENLDFQDLAPLPQPAIPRDRKLFSTLAHQKNLDWLASPTYVAPSVTQPFSEFKLSEKVAHNLESMGFKDAFSVQVGVLNLLLEDIRKNKLSPDFRGDVLVNASTGSGKTLAYLIPIVEALHLRVVPRVRAIVLVPTKPLINQVTQTLRELLKKTVLSVVSLTNDLSIKEESHKILANVPDIIVSTPGRLVEHLLSNSISLEALRFLVIDEADRLLNQSFQNWSEIVINSIEKWVDSNKNTANSWRLQVQKLIFSATLTTDAGKLSLLKFQKPRLVVVNTKEELVNEMFSVPSTLKEYKLRFSSNKSAIKPLILAKYLLATQKMSSVLVFAKSNDATLRLAKLLSLIFAKLNQNVKVAYINSTNNIASVRSRILRDFHEKEIHILVATDLIARGLDILSITDVVNYDLPNSSREYVHRVGRTARANQSGNAYTMCFGKGEEKWFKIIMRDVGRSGEILDVEEDIPIEPKEKQDYEEVLKEFQDSVLKEN